MNLKKRFYLSIFLILLSIVFIVLVKTVDVQPIGPANTEVGFATINKWVFDNLGTSGLCDTITDIYAVAAFAICGFFALIGFLQLLKRKNVFKVDKNILVLGVTYIITIGLYILFEFAVVNYRPIIEAGATLPEASFPSSHTMVTVVVFMTAKYQFSRYIKDKKTISFIYAVCDFVTITAVCFKLLSGVHWFTDILGGVIISSAIICAHFVACIIVKKCCKSKN